MVVFDYFPLPAYKFLRGTSIASRYSVLYFSLPFFTVAVHFSLHSSAALHTQIVLYSLSSQHINWAWSPIYLDPYVTILSLPRPCLRVRNFYHRVAGYLRDNAVVVSSITTPSNIRSARHRQPSSSNSDPTTPLSATVANCNHEQTPNPVQRRQR